MTQLLLHMLGDYVLQSNWMANGKTKSSLPAFVHAIVYSLPFLLIGSPQAWSVIFVTHFFIDRFRIARFVVFSKEFISPPSAWPSWEDSKATGYPSATPAWLATWLMIICDNFIHLCINATALYFL